MLHWRLRVRPSQVELPCPQVDGDDGDRGQALKGHSGPLVLEVTVGEQYRHPDRHQQPPRCRLRVKWSIHYSGSPTSSEGGNTPMTYSSPSIESSLDLDARLVDDEAVFSKRLADDGEI